ncbi:MAG TPA: M20/M25/M40 family metallo-hydrolase [Vicinamibacteria bacterium]|nr:M20/M25/M40 family metallo-hydrolase [Vicinamibacteria bacterium]
MSRIPDHRLPLWAALVPLAAGLSAAAREGPRAGGPEASWLDPYRRPAALLLEAARTDPTAWERITHLTDTFGHRLSGSPGLEAALRWAAAEMERDGLADVRLEKVMVPRWVRGRESAHLVEPFPGELVMLGLGNSVGTGPRGVQAELAVVRSFEELEARGDGLRGKIVLYNVPFTAYGETVRYRGAGASRAARHGAVAVLIRSVGPPGLRTPHTGALRYEEGAPAIPAAAVTTEDADRLQRLTDRGTRVVVRLYMEASMQGEAESANLVADLPGRERPHEIVLVGGHLDSWDVGTGAVDDAGGSVVTWEAVRLVRSAGLRPRRTMRVVLWTNEENGLRGAYAYRDRHAAELADHVLALESDSGVFKPLGFGFSGSPAAREIIRAIAGLLEPIGATEVGASGGGADIGPLVRAAQVPALSLSVEGSRYFMLHHTPADTVDKLDPREVAACAGAVAVMSYVVADMPDRLPR